MAISKINKFWKLFKSFWNYIWNGEGILSWILSIIVAFIIIKYLFYPIIGLIFATNYPIVAIISGSMEHKISSNENPVPSICGFEFSKEQSLSFDEYWDICGSWYTKNTNITQDSFSDFRFKNGMNIGDVIFLRNPGADKIKVGDTIVFIQHKNPAKEPIIHRVVKVYSMNNKIYFQTKGDHNEDSINSETNFRYLNEFEISETELVGRAWLRIPLIGYLKIWVYELIMYIQNLIH